MLWCTGTESHWYITLTYALDLENFEFQGQCLLVKVGTVSLNHSVYLNHPVCFKMDIPYSQGAN